MAGTARDHSVSTVIETEGQICTTSSTTQEVDVITPPTWATYYRIYFSTNAGRVGLSQSETMTTASVLEATDQHSPVPADVWMGDKLIGGNFYVATAEVSTNYIVKYYRIEPR